MQSLPDLESNESPRVEKLLTLLDAFLDSVPDGVFRPAVASDIDQSKQQIADRLLGRVRLRSLTQVRNTTHEMFAKFAKRAIESLQRSGDRPRISTSYRSSAFLDRNDYFKLPFISQMTVHREIAIEQIAADSEYSGHDLIQVERVFVVPERNCTKVIGDHRLMDWWCPLIAQLDAFAEEGRVTCVIHEEIERAGNLDEFVDFGLYGDVAVAIYERKHGYEELLLSNSDSELFRRCERQWDRYFHRTSGAMEWTEMKRRLGPNIIE